MRGRTNKIVLVGGVVTLAIVIGIIVTAQKERSPVVSNPSGFLPCEAAPDPGVEWPCTVTENGRLYAVWDGMKFDPALAPTPFPVPYKPQSIHPDVLDRAEAERIVLDIADYDEVYVGIVHKHYPLECDGDLFCSEAYYHRFDTDRYPDQFNDSIKIQRHGVNYIEVDGDLYLDGFEQLYEPTAVPATPTQTTPSK